MEKKLLPKSFFRKNPLDTTSVAMLVYVSIMFYDQEISDSIMDTEKSSFSAERQKIIDDEKNEIARMDSGEAIVRFMRRGCDQVNTPALTDKVLTMQDQVMTLVLERYRTTGQDRFIEAAVRMFAKCEQVYVQRLKEMYPEIRNPYAQCLACLVFGIQRCEDALPLLLSEYERMKREYLEEAFFEGPLLALYLLCDEL